MSGSLFSRTKSTKYNSVIFCFNHREEVDWRNKQEVAIVEITELEKQLETYKNKIKIMEHALSASAGAYYNINVTKNLVPGTMY